MAKEVSHPAIGGQAVLEGVMLKSDKHLVVSARDPKGKIVSMQRKLKKKSALQKVFFVRGIVNLFEMLKLGIESLTWSGNIASDEDEKIDAKEWISMIALSFLFVIGFFIVLPFFLTKFIIQDKGVLFNIIDGILRIIIFIVYILFMGMSKDIKRVFQYHGAEHKAVHCYEASHDIKAVSVKSCSQYSPLHERCGSSFLMIVLVISILVFSLVVSGSIWLRLAARVILLPVIIGLSYEILKFAAKHKDNPLMKLIMWPGLALQGLTTKEPDNKQLEVAIDALKKLVKLDRKRH